MTALKVVGMYIAFDSRSRFQDVGILCKIGFIIFEAAKSAFNHDVVCPAAFSIHALTDMVFFEKCYVLGACKLTSLIRVQNQGGATLKAFFSAFMTILVSKVSSISKPTIQWLYQSMMAVRYRKPCLMGI